MTLSSTSSFLWEKGGVKLGRASVSRLPVSFVLDRRNNVLLTLTPTVFLAVFFFFLLLSGLRAEKSDTTYLPLALSSSPPPPPSRTAHCLPRGLFIYGGR